MNKQWLMGIGLLALSNLSIAAGWQDSQTITEYFIDGDNTSDRLYVAFDQSPNPDGCRSDARFARVDSQTPKGKYLFSIILSAHASQQTVTPKLEGCDELERPIVTGLRVESAP
ncbi:MAG: hypothetical protein H0V62_06155 [Gammaproteobacteria bacterium]|nr:hypothetical protein [Gammaproteobacteria bacterium]